MASQHTSDPGHIEEHVPLPTGLTSTGLVSPTPYSSRSFTRKALSLRSFALQRKTTVGSKSALEDGWGPIGLNLLHAPPEPLLDFVFVHGLRGGSVKTWCKNEDAQLYWPKAWLPEDPDLQNVRIHSFGYNSDWGETKETSLDLHDFGRALLGGLTTSPHLRKGNKTPILLIGHSMGGLVIKKAYLLAQQDDRYRELVGRIQCMFFLATPHRGSDSAKLLNSVLRASTFLSPKQYITDISRNSAALSVINDEFRFVNDTLQIWSFYETIKTRIGTNSSLIVERDSAVIGDRREIINPLNADHRSICKFDSPSDPNYVFIRNSLVKATEDILAKVFHERAEESQYQNNILEAYMHIVHDPEDDLTTAESKKSPGSCEWVTSLPTFMEWRDSDNKPLLCHWLSGQAGAGKSVITTHIIRHLEKQGVDTCYFFFRHGQKAKQTTSSLLRSLAFQMLSMHPSVRRVLFRIRESGVIFDKDDERGIWRKLFVNGILTVPVPTKQYWVIDGLDECLDAEKLFSLLYNLESNFHIGILFSSRRVPELEKHFARFEDSLCRHHIRLDDTLSDIKQFIEINSDCLPVEPEDRPELIKKLVQKSDGTFLWIELALEELGKIFREDEIDQVLEEVPVGMAPIYKRILDNMANNGRQVNLMRAMMEWAVCGTRPLHTDELQAALTLDLKTKIRNVGRAVEELCGQLLKIDDHGVVQVLHATAREFLLSQDCNPVFQIDKQTTNENLGIVCLQYLNSDEMRTPRHPALLGKQTARSEFVDYACTSFSEHLLSASSSSDDMFLLLDKFLRTNVLSWIEYIVRRKKNLYYVSRASKNIRKCLNRRAKHPPLLAEQYHNIEMWQVDLVRIALKFGDNLIRDPSSIYFLVPPLCPGKTGIHKHFARATNGLQLCGLTNTGWDDCICYIDYRQSRALSLAGGDGIFALGMKSGAIRLHQQTTCQETGSLDHGEPVKLLRFDGCSQCLVSSGYKQLKMWSTDGELLWTIKNESPLAAIAFSEADATLVTVDRHGKLNTLDTKTGIVTLADPQDNHENELGPGQRSSQIILDADICPKTELLAIAYRGRPPQIWSVHQGIMIGTCHMKRDKPGLHIMSVSELLFNPNPDVELLAVAYQDGELAIFDKWPGGHEIKAVAADALTLAATSDGRTLGTGDAIGSIKIWDFETLTLLYCIKSNEHEVRRLAFSGDGFRLYDIRDTKTKVWESSVLGSEAVTKAMEAPVPVIGRDKDTVDITQILAPPQAGVVFVGKDDGAVFVYDPTTGAAISHLYSHGIGLSVTQISCNNSTIATADVFGTVLAYLLGSPSPNGWDVGERLFELSLTGSAIQSIILHPMKPWLLVSQVDSVKLMDIADNIELPFKPFGGDPDTYRSWLWLHRPSTSEAVLLGLREHEIDIFTQNQSTDTNSHPTETLQHAAVLHLHGEDGSALWAVRTVTTDKEGKYIIVCSENTSTSPTTFDLSVYTTPDLSTFLKHPNTGDNPGEPTKTHALSQRPILTIPSRIFKTLFGVQGSDRLVFLDHHLWVRSVDLSKPDVNPPHGIADKSETTNTTNTSNNMKLLQSVSKRHFFIPREFIGSSNGVDAIVTPDDGTVVFPKEGELAVVRNGLERSFPMPDTSGRCSTQSGGQRKKGDEGDGVNPGFDTTLRGRIAGNVTI